jgi:hypothetical protein
MIFKYDSFHIDVGISQGTKLGKTNRSNQSENVQGLHGPRVTVQTKGRGSGSLDQEEVKKGLENNRVVQD